MIDKRMMFSEDPVSTFTRLNSMSLMQAFTYKVGCGDGRPCASLSKKVRLMSSNLLPPGGLYLNEVRASRRVCQLNNALCNGQKLFGAEVHLIVEVPEFEQLFVTIVTLRLYLARP